MMNNGQLIIIFDGPDGCGKTNIAQELSVRLGVPYYKNEAEHQYFRADPSYFIHAVRYVDTYFTGYLEKSGASVILDRAWPSEWIYSKVMGRDTDLTVLHDLDRRHAALGTLIITPYRSSYHTVRDEYVEITDRIGLIHDLYTDFSDWTACRNLRICVDSEDLDEQVRTIIEFINRAQ